MTTQHEPLPRSSDPLSVSVVIPCFNRARLITRALNSIQNQTLLPAEIIIVDDASTDGTPIIAEDWGRQHQIPMTVEVLARNSGPATARNRGIELARSPYVAFLDSDDEYLPSCLETIVEPLTIFKNAVVSFADATVVTPTKTDAGGLFRPHANLQRTTERVEHAGREVLRLIAPTELLLPASVIPTSAACFLRDAALAAGGMPVDYRSGEDWLFWLRLAQEGDFYFQDRNVAVHHRHDENLTHPRSAAFIATEKLRGLASLMDGSVGVKVGESSRQRLALLHRRQIQGWRFHTSRLGVSLYLRALRESRTYSRRTLLRHLIEDPRSAARALFISLVQNLKPSDET